MKFAVNDPGSNASIHGDKGLLGVGPCVDQGYIIVIS
jgi:hypothetical protein